MSQVMTVQQQPGKGNNNQHFS